MNSKNSAPSEPTLVRGITRVHLIGLLINAIIGAGILGLPSKTFALVGSYSVATWLLCACVVLVIALCFADVSTRFRDSGGPYLYALASTFTTAISIAVETRVLTYVVICAALPVLRRRTDVPAARFTLPAGDFGLAAT
jgi:amino acid transporter